MSPQQRKDFLAGFREESGSVAFAVLGGVFSEGIDLPGDQLIGAFVATLGLPPFDAWHDILKQRLQQRFGAGYDYTYLIFTAADSGVVTAMVVWNRDRRLKRPQLMAGLNQPKW